MNYEIRAPKIRLIDENRKLLGVYEVRMAIGLASERGLDLVEVNPESSPPICRLMNFGRYVYEKKRQEREQRKHQHRATVREMRMSLKISDHDYGVKLNKIKEFLTEGDRVKVKLRLKGREMLHANLGMKIMDKLVNDLQEIAKVESPPKQEEQTIIAAFIPQRLAGKKTES